MQLYSFASKTVPVTFDHSHQHERLAVRIHKTLVHTPKLNKKKTLSWFTLSISNKQHR